MTNCCRVHLGGTYNAQGYQNKRSYFDLVPVPVKPRQNYGGCAKDDGACMANVFVENFSNADGDISKDDFSSELVQNMLLDMCTSK